MEFYFTDLRFLWLLIPAAAGMIWLKGRIRFIQAGAAVTLILAASGPVLLWEKSPETVILRDHSAAPAAALAKTGADMRYGGKIDFHSSFYESTGSIEKTAASLAVRNIALRAVPHPGRQASQPVLRQLHHPAVIGCGERWEIQLELAVRSNSNADLILREQNRILFKKQYTFQAEGCRNLKFSCHLQEPGEHTVRLELNGKTAAELAVRVEKPYPVLLISRNPVREGNALRRLLHGAAEVTPWKGGMDFSRFPLIVIGERGGQTLKQSELKQLPEAIRKGSGLLIFTGRDTPFIPRSLPKELEEMLPVRYTARNLDRTPTTSLVVIIDTSGSMMGTRIALARETARLALDKLRDCDLAGIVEFHGRRRWAAPLQSAANHLELRRALNRLNAGGGTIILPAVREAFYALRNADTRLKHVLIITDGGVEQGNFEELLRQMARNDITVSTVLAGNGQSPFLEQLALWGGGRYYTASSRFAIPELTFRQTGRENLSPAREGRFPLEIRSQAPMTAGLSEKMVVEGILETSLTPGADELVRAAGMPLIARKNTGNGSVVSVNTELDGPWVKELRADPHFSGMLASLARSLPDPARLAPYAVRNYSIHRCVDLQIDSFRPVDRLYLDLNDKEHFILNRGEDGSFHFRRSGMKPVACRVGIRETEKGGHLYVFRIIPRQGPENGWCADDLETAERINRRSARVQLPEKIPFPIRLRPVLGIISLLLFLLQVLLRRLPGGQLSAVVLLIACGPAFGGEYEQFLQAGLRNRQGSAALFRKAVQAAANPSDRRFALMLELESARRNGTVKELLREWEKTAAADPERLDLLLCELEDDRQAEKALNLLLRRADLADRRFTIQLIRLAEKCGKTAMIRDLALREMKNSPDQLIWLNAAVRLELLAGRRTEAVRLYDERIRQENDPGILSAIADAAEKTALYSCAEAAYVKLGKLPGTDTVSVRFRQIDLQLRKGDPRSALKLARRFAGQEDLDPGTLMSLADRCERLGDPETALKLYRRSNEEEATIRQAMLLGGLKRNQEAVRCWEKLLRDTENDMRAMQAMERIIALSAEDRQLPRLIHSLEGNPEIRKSERMKLFYCRVLLAAGNTGSLWKFLERFGSLEQKLNFRLEVRQYSEAVKLLEESLKKYPERREELLRDLTVIAIESKDLKLAERSVEELMKTAVDRKAALQFSAGVYTLLDQPAKAVEIYDECIRLDPSGIELLLLRANAQKAAGETEKALVFFQEKLKDNPPPDLFGILADGLLNLGAGRSLLRETLNLTMERLRKNPDLLFYYRLAEDLAEELGDQELWRRLQLMQLAAAPERRSLLMRGLFEEALRRNAGDDAYYYARMLISWNEIYTPELYQALARCLTDHGCFSAAERCMRQADAAENTHQNQFGLIQVCLDSGRPDDAVRIARELLSLAPDSPDFLIRYAAVLERQGKYEQAGEQNLKALTVLASRQTVGTQSGKGSRNSAFEKSIRPVINAFAGQAFLYPEKFDAALKRLARDAAPSAKKLVWQPLLRRIAELKGPRPVRRRNLVSRRSKTEPPLEILLAASPPDRAVKIFQSAMKKIPLKQRGTHLGRLIGVLCFDPGPELTAAMHAELEKVKLSNFHPSWIRQPYALGIKRLYAGRMLRQHPESIPAMTLSAQLRNLAGKSASSRLLAGEIFDRFTNGKTMSFQDIRSLECLNLVFAAAPGESPDRGAGMRQNWLRSLESDRKLLGDTPQRIMLSSLLLEGEGEFDRAFELLLTLWKTGTRDVIIFRKLETLAVQTLRYREWLETISAYGSRDPSVQILASRRQVQLYRDYGMADHARSKLGMMPPLLEKRERILLDYKTLSKSEFAAALGSFLIDQCRAGSYVGLYSENFGVDGLKGRKIRGVMRPNLLPSLSVCSPELERTLAYLIAGMPITERGFAVLFETWRNLAPAKEPAFLAGEKTAPQLIAMKAAAGRKLSSKELTILRRTAVHSELMPETALILLELLPERERGDLAFELGMKYGGSPYFRPNQMHRRFLDATSHQQREKLLRHWTGQTTFDHRQKFELLHLCRKYAPESFSELQKALIRHDAFPMSSECYLLYGKELPETRLRNFILASDHFPDWEKLLSFDEGKSLLRTAEKVLEKALVSHLLTEDQLVRHYALLAVSDPLRKDHWLACSARHDRILSEASLWRLDAMENTPGWQILHEKLRNSGRLPPGRIKNNKKSTLNAGEKP